MDIGGRQGRRPEARIARRVVTLRMLEGLTRAELARAAQISESRATEIEQGVGRPRGKELFQLAAALGVDFEQLTADIELADVAEHNGIASLTGKASRNDRIERSLSRLRRDHEFQDLLRQLALRVSKQ